MEENKIVEILNIEEDRFLGENGQFFRIMIDKEIVNRGVLKSIDFPDKSLTVSRFHDALIVPNGYMIYVQIDDIDYPFDPEICFLRIGAKFEAHQDGCEDSEYKDI